MRIVVLFPRFGIGGIAKASAFVANAFIKNGHSVTCVSMSDDDNLQDFNAGIKLVYLPYERKNKSSISVRDKLLFLVKFRKLLANERYDWIISLGTDLVRISTIASMGLNISILGSERGNPYLYSEKQKHKSGLILNPKNSKHLPTDSLYEINEKTDKKEYNKIFLNLTLEKILKTNLFSGKDNK